MYYIHPQLRSKCFATFSSFPNSSDCSHTLVSIVSDTPFHLLRLPSLPPIFWRVQFLWLRFSFVQGLVGCGRVENPVPMTPRWAEQWWLSFPLFFLAARQCLFSDGLVHVLCLELVTFTSPCNKTLDLFATLDLQTCLISNSEGTSTFLNFQTSQLSYAVCEC